VGKTEGWRYKTQAYSVRGGSNEDGSSSAQEVGKGSSEEDCLGDQPSEALPRDMELVIFRLVQECLTNIRRHSESETASIRIARETNQITLDIRDQGKGTPARVWLRFNSDARASE
jgi:hypothetical protein